jgi:hypothetical protein
VFKSKAAYLMRWEKYEYTHDSSNGNRIVEPELFGSMNATKTSVFSFFNFLFAGVAKEGHYNRRNNPVIEKSL